MRSRPAIPGDGTPDADATDTPGATATVEPVPTVAPTATVEPAPPPAEPLTCQNIVPQTRLDTIAAAGWTLWEPTDYFAKLRGDGFDYPQLRFQDNGGIVCAWTVGNHVAYVYGYSPLPADQIAPASAQVLASDPYAESTFAGGPLFTVQMDENPYRLFWIDNMGSWFLASEERVLDELRRQNP